MKVYELREKLKNKDKDAIVLISAHSSGYDEVLKLSTGYVQKEKEEKSEWYIGQYGEYHKKDNLKREKGVFIY